MNYILEKTFVIMWLTNSGHLEVPTCDYYGRKENIFYDHYDSMEDVEKAILENSRDDSVDGQPFIIVTKLTRIEKPEE